MKVLILLMLISISKGAPNSAREESDRCKTLCEEGLGGEPCGCPPQKVASVIQKKMDEWRLAHPEEHVIRGPRRDLCPSLCQLGLGQPLCDCMLGTNATASNDKPSEGDWCMICRDILLREKAPGLWIQLGCHELTLQRNCKDLELSQAGDVTAVNLFNRTIEFFTFKADDSQEVDWNLWCEIQCDRNNGGLACNCDMLPLSAH